MTWFREIYLNGNIRINSLDRECIQRPTRKFVATHKEKHLWNVRFPVKRAYVIQSKKSGGDVILAFNFQPASCRASLMFFYSFPALQTVVMHILRDGTTVHANRRLSQRGDGVIYLRNVHSQTNDVVSGVYAEIHQNKTGFVTFILCEIFSLW